MLSLARSARVVGGWPSNRGGLAAPCNHNAARFKHAHQASSTPLQGPFEGLPRIRCMEDLTKASGYGSTLIWRTWIFPNGGLTPPLLLLQLMHESPLAREVVELLAAPLMAEQVRIYHAPNIDPLAYTVVERQSLADACSSLDSLHAFLREELGIAAGQEIDVSWADDVHPGGKQYQLTQTAEAAPLPYIVGRAVSWFVAEKQ